MIKRIIGVVLFCGAICLFFYVSLWICLVQPVWNIIKGFKYGWGEISVPIQLLKVFIGFPVIECGSILIAITGIKIFHS